jgi:hypothetical protein
VPLDRPDVPQRAPPRNRGEALEAVAEAVGGRLEEAKVKGGYVVIVEHGPWSLTLDLHVVSSGSAVTVHTRVVSFFLSREDVKLTVRRRTFWDAAAEKLGLGGPVVGDRAFTRRYIAKGRPESRVRSILSGGLADALAVPWSLGVEVKRAPRRRRKTMGQHARQLQVLAPGVDTDVDRMVGAFKVACAALDVLGRIGSASSEPIT